MTAWPMCTISVAPRAEEVHAEELAVHRRDEELEHPGGITADLAPSQFAVTGDPTS